VYKYSAEGEFLLTYGRGIVKGPVGIVCDPRSGDLYVSSYKSNQVMRFSAEGQFVGVAAGSGAGSAGAAGRQTRAPRRTISSPTGLSFGGDGTLWVASYTVGSVTRFNNSEAGGRTYWRVTD
jgi:streptogramin lyase